MIFWTVYIDAEVYFPCRHVQLVATCSAGYSAPDRGAEYCDECVCLSVFLFVRDHVFGTTHLIFTRYFVRVTYCRGSVPVLRHMYRCVLLVPRMT